MEKLVEWVFYDVKVMDSTGLGLILIYTKILGVYIDRVPYFYQ